VFPYNLAVKKLSPFLGVFNPVFSAIRGDRSKKRWPGTRVYTIMSNADAKAEYNERKVLPPESHSCSNILIPIPLTYCPRSLTNADKESKDFKKYKIEESGALLEGSFKAVSPINQDTWLSFRLASIKS
jgi:hypothetical protein